MSSSKLRRAVITVAATGLAGAGLLAAHPAAAAPTVPAASADSITALTQQLGDRTAGSYLDSAGRSVVNVTDKATADLVTKAGATPRYVAHSAVQLRAVTDALTVKTYIPGTAWAVDPVTNQVLVSYDSTVSKADVAKLTAVAGAYGDTARLESLPGKLSLTASGGDAIYSGQYRCSLGFNVRSGSTYYFLTAGHCGNIGPNWYSNSSKTNLLGTTQGSSFPGNDYAIVKYAAGVATPPGTVGSQDITSSGTPSVGQTVTRRGSTTGIHSGTVTALNSSVTYAEGRVSGLIRTTVCAEGGDSGGSLYSGSTAYGLTSGGSGNCSSGGVTYFQPVTEALSVYGVSVY